jgi:pimeloyl-ACP methyl ester carboxylesterase
MNCVLKILFISFFAGTGFIPFAYSMNTPTVSDDLSNVWINNYPVISKSITSVFIKIRLKEPGKVYYVFYDTVKNGITADKIKSDAMDTAGGEIIKNGIINYPNISLAQTLLVDGFNQSQYSHLYFVAEQEDSTALDTDIRQFQFPMKLKHRIVPVGTTAATFGYLEYLPVNYCVDCLKPFPMIVFLHGAGGVGDGTYAGLTDPVAALREGLTRYIEIDMDLPAVVISPQALGSWNVDQLNGFIKFLVQEYNVDPQRIYITGISMGGQGAWEYASTYPDQIAAVVPLCGSVGSLNNYSELADRAVWAFHNNMDPTVSVSYTYANIDGLRKAGGHPLMSIFRSDDHSCAYEAYHYPGLWDWMFSQNRDSVYNDGGIVAAYQSDEKPVVNGMLDENCWSIPQIAVAKIIKGTRNDSATFKLLWDTAYLYAGIEIKGISSDLSSKKKEVILYLNGDNDTNTFYDSSDNYLIFTYGSDSVQGTGDHDGIKYGWQFDGNNYFLEVGLPFRNSYYPSPIAGDGFGFDIQINIEDSANSNSDDYIWNGSMGNMDSTTHFGHALLSLGYKISTVSVSNWESNENKALNLDQNYPNPFEEKTTVSYSINTRTKVILQISDLSGRSIRQLVNTVQSAGTYKMEIDGSSLNSGVYLIELITPEGKKFKQLVKL